VQQQSVYNLFQVHQLSSAVSIQPSTRLSGTENYHLTMYTAEGGVLLWEIER